VLLLLGNGFGGTHSEYEEIFVLSSYLTKIFDSIFLLSSCWAKDFDRVDLVNNKHIGFRRRVNTTYIYSHYILFAFVLSDWLECRLNHFESVKRTGRARNRRPWLHLNSNYVTKKYSWLGGGGGGGWYVHAHSTVAYWELQHQAKHKNS
jgi:hypothetical protein